MARPTNATIHTDALRHNLSQVRALAPRSRVMAVVKADGYGHGLERVARALQGADAFGVAALSDAERLRAAGLSQGRCEAHAATTRSRRSAPRRHRRRSAMSGDRCSTRVLGLEAWPVDLARAELRQGLRTEDEARRDFELRNAVVEERAQFALGQAVLAVDDSHRHFA